MRQKVELKDTIKWDKFEDGWPNLFIEDVRKDCAGRDGMLQVCLYKYTGLPFMFFF